MGSWADRPRAIVPAVAMLLILASCTGSAAQSPSALPSSAATPTVGPSPSTASIGPSASPATAEPSPGIGENWTETFSTDVTEARVTGEAIAHGSAGFLVLGGEWETAHGGPQQIDRFMWLSPDGRSWEELPPPEQADGSYVHLMTSSASGDFVMYFDRSVNEPDPRSELVGIHSADGRTWSEFDHGLPPSLWVQEVTLGPSGYLLVGEEANPTLWLSDNGLSWERVHAFEHDDFFTQLADADGGEEGYVVVGRAIASDSTYRRFSFASADGRDWVRRDEPFGADDQDFVFTTTVTSVGPDWLATIGQRDGAPSEVWFSANGLDWTPRGTVDADGNTVSGVFEEIGGEVLFAPGKNPPWDGMAGAWTSTDGETWEPVGLADGAWVGGYAEGSGVAAMVVTTPGGGQFSSSASVWIRSSE